MVTYVKASFEPGRYAVIRVNSSGPSYSVIAVCGTEQDAIDIAAALNGA